MARSTTRTNLRPDTLMQDRRRQFDEIFLQRTAGPYIRVKMRNTRKEQIISASPLSTDIIKHERQVGKVPKAVDRKCPFKPDPDRFGAKPASRRIDLSALPPRSSRGHRYSICQRPFQIAINVVVRQS